MSANLTESEHCANGGCTRPLYRGKKCYRCWAGDKWTSMWQRVKNVTGKNSSYEGIPIGFSKDEFIQWVLDNPPPQDMEVPSIDRIVPSEGYVPGNIRWLERNRNSAGPQRDVKPGYKRCPICQQTLPATTKYFGKRNGKRWGVPLQTYCIPCKREYCRAWSAKKKEANHAPQ